jgi:monoamine oxidase
MLLQGCDDAAGESSSGSSTERFLASMPTQGSTKTGSLPPDQVDVAIVGGGISGTYTAYRLLSSGKFRSEQVALFERTNRVGGRYDSPVIGCGDAQTLSEDEQKHAPRSELGGMIVRDTDTLMRGVARELGIELGPFHMNKGIDVDSRSGDDPSNPIYLRGLRTDRRSVTEASSSGNFIMMGPNGSMDGSSHALPFVQQYDNGVHDNQDQQDEPQEGPGAPPVDETEEPPLESRQVDPCNPSNGDLMNRIVDGTSQRVWELSPFSRDSLRGMTEENREFDNDVAWGNCGAASRSTRNLGVDEEEMELRSAVGLREDKLWDRPLLGMEEFPSRLQRRYHETFGGRTFMGQQLKRVEKVAGDVSHSFKLTFEETSTSPCSGITSLTGRTWTLQAERVILAMPKAPLESIDFVGFSSNSKKALGAEIERLLAAIRGVPFMKLHASFSERWWQETGIGKSTNFNVGRFASTSPVNNLFAWYPGTQARDADGGYAQIPAQCKNAGGANMGVLQMYSTVYPGDTWESFLRNGQQRDCDVTDASMCHKCFSKETSFFTSRFNTTSNHVPQVLVDGWRMELAYMFGVEASEIPDPTELQYKVWDAKDPVTRSDATHYWQAGQEWWKLYDRVLEIGGHGTKLHIVGEAFSFNWGWGEGALETAEYMLHEHMHLPLPPWLQKRDYCLAMPFYPFERH